jgi:hypothetical protein
MRDCPFDYGVFVDGKYPERELYAATGRSHVCLHHLMPFRQLTTEVGKEMERQMRYANNTVSASRISRVIRCALLGLQAHETKSSQ